MKKTYRFTAIASAAMMLFAMYSAPMQASAATNDRSGITIDGICYRQNGTYSIFGYLPEDAYEDYIVADSCKNKSVTEVTLPETFDGVILGEPAVMYLKRINQAAFFECASLEKVTLPDTMTAIDQNAFRKAVKLSEINLPDSITSIGEYAFAFTALSAVRLPKELEKLDKYAFGGCTLLSSFEIAEDAPNFRTEKGILYSSDMKKLVLFPQAAEIEQLIVPDTVEEIGYGAFLLAENLKEVDLSESVKIIKEGAFQLAEMQKLTIRNADCLIEDKNTIPDTVTICAAEGSTAQKYAEKHGNAFEVLNIRGDLNGDSTVNLKDVVLLCRSIAGGWDTALNETTADLNGDGSVNLKDVVLLRRYVAGGWNVSL